MKQKGNLPCGCLGTNAKALNRESEAITTHAAGDSKTPFRASLLGAGEGNRTLVSSLGSWCSAIELRPRGRRLYASSIFSMPTILMQTVSRSIVFLSSSKDGKVGAMRMLLSFGSF